MDAREIVARALNVDRCGFDPDKPDEFDYHAADAVLAALTAAGLLDRTGALLTRALSAGDVDVRSLGGKLGYGVHHRNVDGRLVFGTGATPADALESAIAAAEDGR